MNQPPAPENNGNAKRGIGGIIPFLMRKWGASPTVTKSASRKLPLVVKGTRASLEQEGMVVSGVFAFQRLSVQKT